MYQIIICFLTAFLLTYMAIPSIIKISRYKKLMDDPGERASHHKSIPTLGGIGIFAGVIFSIILWTPFEVFGNLQYILSAFVIIFLIGAKDDIMPLTPYKKMLGQLFAAVILVFKANIRITSFYGIMGVGYLPEWASVIFSIFTILLVINAFNLIDGINTLCASTGILICTAFGYWFKETDQVVLSIIAFSLVGSLMAFMKYNISPAQIFMGDTGSMLVGTTCAILAIRFIEINPSITVPDMQVSSAPALALALLFIPLYDTVRVTIIRIWEGRSPFRADKQHIHHVLVAMGYNHLQATSILISVNALMIVMATLLNGWGNMVLMLLILFAGIIFSFIIYLLSRNRPIENTY